MNYGEYIYSTGSSIILSEFGKIIWPITGVEEETCSAVEVTPFSFNDVEVNKETIQGVLIDTKTWYGVVDQIRDLYHWIKDTVKRILRTGNKRGGFEKNIGVVEGSNGNYYLGEIHSDTLICDLEMSSEDGYIRYYSEPHIFNVGKSVFKYKKLVIINNDEYKSFIARVLQSLNNIYDSAKAIVDRI